MTEREYNIKRTELVATIHQAEHDFFDTDDHEVKRRLAVQFFLVAGAVDRLDEAFQLDRVGIPHDLVDEEE